MRKPEMMIGAQDARTTLDDENAMTGLLHGCARTFADVRSSARKSALEKLTKIRFESYRLREMILILANGWLNNPRKFESEYTN